MGAFFSSSPQPEFLEYELDFPAVFPVVLSHFLGGCGFCPSSKLPGKPVFLAKQDSVLRVTVPSHFSQILLPLDITKLPGWCQSPLVVKIGLSSGPTQLDSLPSGSTTDPDISAQVSLPSREGVPQTLALSPVSPGICMV